MLLCIKRSSSFSASRKTVSEVEPLATSCAHKKATEQSISEVGCDHFQFIISCRRRIILLQHFEYLLYLFAHLLGQVDLVLTAFHDKRADNLLGNGRAQALQDKGK